MQPNKIINGAIWNVTRKWVSISSSPAPQSTTNVAANTVYKSHQPAVQHTGFRVEPNYPSQDGGEKRGRRSGRRQKQGLTFAGEEQQGREVTPARSNRGGLRFLSRRGATGGSERRPARSNQGQRSVRSGRLNNGWVAERQQWGGSRSSCRWKKMGGSRSLWQPADKGGSRSKLGRSRGPREGRRRAAGCCFAKGSPGGD
ncbi:hypothetical protein Fot_32308 [Forsythia ovata]|uniref:Uncharacterized protein n=1 Tax=Forsythia ovata TaxID=205694 RepID=A0ABD1T7P1_9LAMI